jgi:hypothetical protein
VARRAPEHGVTLGWAVSVDMKAVVARKNRILQRSVDSRRQGCTGALNVPIRLSEEVPA